MERGGEDEEGSQEGGQVVNSDPWRHYTSEQWLMALNATAAASIPHSDDAAGRHAAAAY